jgi:hypothetical protein
VKKDKDFSKWTTYTGGKCKYFLEMEKVSRATCSGEKHKDFSK